MERKRLSPEQNRQARREKTARLFLLSALICCVLALLGPAVDFALSFRRDAGHVSAQASFAASLPEGKEAAPDRALPSPDSAAPEKKNLNLATEEDLQAVPGIGPELARRILEARQQMGGFYFLEEVKDVPGIGEKRFEALKESFFCEPIPDPSSGM